MGVLTLTAILQFWYSITSSNASPAHGQINDSAERNGHALSHPSAINGHPPSSDEIFCLCDHFRQLVKCKRALRRDERETDSCGGASGLIKDDLSGSYRGEYLQSFCRLMNRGEKGLSI